MLPVSPPPSPSPAVSCCMRHAPQIRASAFTTAPVRARGSISGRGRQQEQVEEGSERGTGAADREGRGAPGAARMRRAGTVVRTTSRGDEGRRRASASASACVQTLPAQHDVYGELLIVLRLHLAQQRLPNHQGRRCRIRRQTQCWWWSTWDQNRKGQEEEETESGEQSGRCFLTRV